MRKDFSRRQGISIRPAIRHLRPDNRDELTATILINNAVVLQLTEARQMKIAPFAEREDCLSGSRMRDGHLNSCGNIFGSFFAV